MGAKDQLQNADPTVETAQADGPPPKFAFYDLIDRSFLRAVPLSERTGLFVLIAMICLAAGGFGLFRVQQSLHALQNNLVEAYELNRLVNTVETSAWRLRFEGVRLGQAGPASTEDIDAHIGKAIEFGRLLDRIHKRFSTQALGSHIFAIREDLAQYAESYTPSGARDADTTLEKIIFDIIQNINGLRGYAIHNLTEASRLETQGRNFYLPMIAVVGAGLLLVVLLAGMLMLRSVIRPLMAITGTGHRQAAIKEVPALHRIIGTLPDGNMKGGLPGKFTENTAKDHPDRR